MAVSNTSKSVNIGLALVIFNVMVLVLVPIKVAPLYAETLIIQPIEFFVGKLLYSEFAFIVVSHTTELVTPVAIGIVTELLGVKYTLASTVCV